MDVDVAVKTEEQQNVNQIINKQILNDNSFPMNNDETDLILAKPILSRMDTELNGIHELNCKLNFLS
jgi:hypothetical protein